MILSSTRNLSPLALLPNSLSELWWCSNILIKSSPKSLAPSRTGTEWVWRSRDFEARKLPCLLGRGSSETNHDGVAETPAVGPRGDIASLISTVPQRVQGLLSRSTVFSHRQSMSPAASRLALLGHRGDPLEHESQLPFTVSKGS